jgi:hypothetical protein
MSRFNINPRKLLIRTRFNYEKLPGAESQTSSPLFSTPILKSWKQRNAWASRIQRPRMSFARILALAVTLMLIFSMIATGVYRRRVPPGEQKKSEERKLYHWEHYPR